MEKSIIVAVADNLAIGKDNALLWHIAEDMKYFRKTTTGFPVIMGYMTFKSIGRPLPNRRNIVISIYPFDDAPEGVIVVSSLSEAFAAAEDAGKCFVIGGGETYRQALPVADTLYITHVHAVIRDADTFFPVIDPSIWEDGPSSLSSMKDPESGYAVEFKVYKRRSFK
ncbi:MAG: dihydrofolate reductase [Bacteroidales bacterium]|jgi:dihydrofolate reductase|nr:dihydrofolate reductase [Bacteroidales bacterium]MCI1784837.1 dihydrofolate reductase [Bacteroidales bacterium]